MQPGTKVRGNRKSMLARQRAILTINQLAQAVIKCPTVLITTIQTEAAMDQSTDKEIWIGMVKVLSLPSSEILPGVSGAYANVLTWASNSSEFRAKAKELMDYLGLKLVGVEYEEPLSERERRGEVDSKIAQVALEVKGNPKSIRYLTFHTWTELNA
jgi:hypothetical protein